jgi:GT2 family glycosyltransferase
MTLKALTTLRDVTLYPNYEVILVDDCSRENMDSVYNDTRLYDKLLKLPQRSGNSTIAVNEGVKLSSGEFIQYQNNDVYFEDPYWLDKIIDAFDEDTAVVGPALLCPDKTIQCAGFSFDRRGLNHNLYSFKLYETLEKKTIEAPMVTGCGLTTRRDIYDKLQGFRVFQPHGWDDADWCLRVKENGYKVRLCLDSYFYHIGTVSYSGMDTPEYHSNRKNIFRKYKSLIKEISHYRLDRQKYLFVLKDLCESEAILNLLDSIRRYDLGRKSELLVLSCEPGQLRGALQKCGARVFPPKWEAQVFHPLFDRITSMTNRTTVFARNTYNYFLFIRSEMPDSVIYDEAFAKMFGVIRFMNLLLADPRDFSKLSLFDKKVQALCREPPRERGVLDC